MPFSPKQPSTDQDGGANIEESLSSTDKHAGAEVAATVTGGRRSRGDSPSQAEMDIARPSKRVRLVDDSMDGVEEASNGRLDNQPEAQAIQSDELVQTFTPTSPSKMLSNAHTDSSNTLFLFPSSSSPSLPPLSTLANPTNAAPTVSGPTAHSFWFEDGDVVLGVEDVFFRVHGARLASASATFAMVALLPGEQKRPPSGSPGEPGTECVDGCPFIRMKGDSPKDWLIALEAIYDPMTFQTRPVILDTLAGALRISTKYNIKSLREWAITQMRTTWPVKLEHMGPMALPHAAEAIALARECNVPEILPAAFYALSIQKWRAGTDGGRAHTVLSSSDLRKLVIGREALQDVLVEIVVAPLSTGPISLTKLASTSSTDDRNRSWAWAIALPSGVAPRSSLEAKAVPLQPSLTFCSPPASCRFRLETLWRARLSPDPTRAWGTWLLRELYRMATLPLSALTCPSELTLELEQTQESPVTGWNAGEAGGVNAPLGSNPGVCTHCWEENRRLALWRLDRLRESIPAMFML